MFILFNIIYIMRTLAYGGLIQMSASGYIDMAALPLFFRATHFDAATRKLRRFRPALAAEKLSKRHFLAETETLRTCRKYPLKGKHLRQNMLTAFDFLSEVEFRFEQIVGKVPLYLLDVETTLQRQAIFCHSASGELLTG